LAVQCALGITQVGAVHSIEEQGDAGFSQERRESDYKPQSARQHRMMGIFDRQALFGCRDMEGAADQLHQMDLQREVSG